MPAAIQLSSVSKLYRLGTVGTGTLSHDLNRWWHAIRGKEDPYTRIGQVNDRENSSPNANRVSTSDTLQKRPLWKLPTSNLLSKSPDYVWALRDINLEIEQGEIVGIIGRNGAGKSTLLKLLSRVTAPTEGTIKSRGRIASLLEVGTGFHPELTGRENIYMNGTLLGMRRHEITRHLDEIIEFSGCAKYIDTPVKRYSSGMTVRLGFAVAAHLNCEILIVDEVLAVGDADFQNKCIGKMKQISTKAGKTVLFVSHNLGSVSNLCNKGVMLSRGSIEKIGEIERVIELYQKSSLQTDELTIESCRNDASRQSIRPVEFTKIEFANGASVLPQQSDLVFRLALKALASVPPVSIGGSVKRLSGESVTTFFTRDRISLHADHETTLVLKISGLPLVPGEYMAAFSVGTGDETSRRHDFDVVIGMPQFEILPTGSTGKAMSFWHAGWGALCWSERVTFETIAEQNSPTPSTTST